MNYYIYSNELSHHGVLGMRWGIRRHQPYPDGHKGGKEVGEAARVKKKQRKEMLKRVGRIALRTAVVTSSYFIPTVITGSNAVGIGVAAGTLMTTNRLINQKKKNQAEVNRLLAEKKKIDNAINEAADIRV